MKLGFYPHLAMSGIHKNARLYTPYLLACAFMVAMLYVMAYLSNTPSLYAFGSGVNGAGTGAINLVMHLGSVVVAAFAALFLFYTNAFLIRRRKKEFGLYNVLGMDRGAIASILFWETAFTAAFALIAGILFGAAFSFLAVRVLARMVGAGAPTGFRVDVGAVRLCVIAFALIFALLFLNTLRQVRRSGAVNLLHSESFGEKPPRSQWLLVIPGVALLAGAYYLAVTIHDPVQAILLFFVAVLMVIAATYLLFVAGSVTLCRRLQKNEKFYYQKRNFVALSSLVYRMKRNGAGLASICILSTMVLVMLGSTASLYFGIGSMIRTLAAQSNAQISTAEFYETYGSLFFLAILLSVLFLLASALTLYYKQVAEGYEDAARFAIMRRVGMTARDIRESVNAQMLLLFLLPLAAAFIHLAFAQPMIWQILQLFGLRSLAPVLGVTAGACVLYALLYTLACRLSANAYCRVVGGKI